MRALLDAVRRFHVPWGHARGPALAVVVGMLVLGALILTTFQTQQLFKDSVTALDEGRLPRNDGAIGVSAVLIGVGLALFLALGSPLPPRDRLLPAALVAACVIPLVALHFTIFVNSVLLDDFTVALFKASFVFQESAVQPPLAVFFLALVTALLVGALLRAIWSLYGRTSFERHLGHLATPGALRNQALLAGTLMLLSAALFAGAFLRTGLRLERVDATGGWRANVAFLDYLVVLGLALLGLAVATRTTLVVWRHAWFPHLRHPEPLLDSARYAEYVLLGLLAALNLLVLIMYPAAQDNVEGTRGDFVFVYSDRGLSFLFWFLALPYAVFARAAQRAKAKMALATRSPKRLDPNAVFVLGAVVGGGLLALLAPEGSEGALRRFILVGAFLAVFTGVRAFGFAGRDGAPGVSLRADAGPFAVAFFALSWTTGLMLWGLGNTVEANYVRDGDLVTLTDTQLQAFAVAYRFLASLFFAVPIVLGLDAATPWRSPKKYGPLVLVLFGLIIGTHLLFPIAYETPFDRQLQTTDVVVGFASVAQEPATRAFVTVVWIVLALVTLLATHRILTERKARRS